MTFISLTHASRALGVDPKTLRRWLADEPLPLLWHESDRQLKGIRQAQLHELALRHHRHLSGLPTPSPAAPPLDGPAEQPSLLLDLSVQLEQVQQQLTALCQQVAALAAGRHTCEPAPCAPTAVPPARVAQSTALRAAVSTPAVKAPSKPAEVLARVEYATEGHYVLICPTHGVLPFEPDSREWVGWLASQTAFRFVGQAGRLTAHREVDRLHPRPWRAHRTLRNRTHNLPLAHGEHLTIAVLEQAAATFQAQLD